jgi:DNA-binding response OmpR family regulator
MINGKIEERILIIDDDNNLHHVLTHILEGDGYKLLHALDGRSGLQMALAEIPDLIMLDMNLPIMNGLEILDELNRADQSIPVIFMTYFGSKETAIKAFHLGVHFYLSKPLNLEEVRQTVTKALTQTRLRQEKNEMERNLIAADAVRQTVVTLSHHINNQLMVIQTSLALMEEQLYQEQQELKQLLTRSQKGVEQIAAVLTVLQGITGIEPIEYFESVQMLDIMAAVEKELSKASASN